MYHVALPVSFQEAFSEFHQLEDRISNVATKVVHLGEQLESTNIRRLRGMEAQKLMHHLSEFQAKAKPSMPVFTDPARVSKCALAHYVQYNCSYIVYERLHCVQKLDAADLIFKLHGLSQDLPQATESVVTLCTCFWNTLHAA